MYRLNKTILLFSSFFILFSCKVNKPPVYPSPEEVTEVTEANSTVTADTTDQVVIYQPEATRHFKLVHSKLEIAIDWKKQHILGKAAVTLKPYFYPQSILKLDAKNFEIQAVSLLLNGKDQTPEFQYDGREITISLGKEVSREEDIQVTIEYRAKGYDGDTTSNLPNDQKGFYFVNAAGDPNEKTQQVWTQGETACNSRWFPTIEAPNQKMTQEIFITVDNKFTTLSNGKLVYSKSNTDGSRTDFWNMDMPHAPYLAMFAVGDFQVVQDKLKDLEVNYYVEPAYAPFAKDIFGNTPEMIDYFGQLLNVPYPWQKYSQIIVRDFVTGAMENTTGTVFMEDLYMTRRELIDYSWDDIISHELFHHWFGDYVTCESWANLPLNESFATYGEYLWFHHKYGADEAAYHLLEDLETYLEEAETKNEDLVRFGYIDSEEMFDAHSYSKGGLIMHSLRNYLGDEAFFRSLELYLKSHAYGKAEVHELRMAFEQISGEDLNWFFNQWMYASGHPKLKVEESYNDSSKIATVKIWQSQDLEEYPVYRLHLTTDIWQAGVKEQFIITLNKPYQEFEFSCKSKPELILVDSEYILVGEKDHSRDVRQLALQFKNYPQNMRARLEAFRMLKQNINDTEATSIMERALSDPFWVLRQEAIDFIESDSTGLFSLNEKKLTDMAISDKESAVRTSAFSCLITHPGNDYCDIYKVGMADSSYSVAGFALYGYLQCNVEDKEGVVDSFIKETNFSITSTLADYFISENAPGQKAWFRDRLQLYTKYEQWYFVKFYGMYLAGLSKEEQVSGIPDLTNLAQKNENYYIRLAAYQSLQLLEDNEGVPEFLKSIKDTEKDQRVLQYME